VCQTQPRGRWSPVLWLLVRQQTQHPTQGSRDLFVAAHKRCSGWQRVELGVRPVAATAGSQPLRKGLGELLAAVLHRTSPVPRRRRLLQEDGHERLAVPLPLRGVERHADDVVREPVTVHDLGGQGFLKTMTSHTVGLGRWLQPPLRSSGGVFGGACEGTHRRSPATWGGPVAPNGKRCTV
jgi:hypothetical protein